MSPLGPAHVVNQLIGVLYGALWSIEIRADINPQLIKLNVGKGIQTRIALGADRQQLREAVKSETKLVLQRRGEGVILVNSNQVKSVGEGCIEGSQICGIIDAVRLVVEIAASDLVTR